MRNAKPLEMIILRISANGEDCLKLRHGGKQLVMPCDAALAPRRQIALARVMAGKTEAHRDNRDAASVIEGVAVDAHPRSQPVAGRIVETHPRIMRANARRLTGDEQTRRR